MTTHPTVLKGLVDARHRDLRASVSPQDRGFRREARSATGADAPPTQGGASDAEPPKPRPAVATVDDIVRRKVPAVAPEAPLWDVAAILAEDGITGVPVVDGPGAVVGVVTEKDIVQCQHGRPEGRAWWWRRPASRIITLAPPSPE